MSPNPSPPAGTSFSEQAKAAFREFVSTPEFPCLGAKAAFNADSHTIAVFDELGSMSATDKLAVALYDFTCSPTGSSSHEYATFIAVFEQPRDLTEVQFENLLWRQLRLLHAHDAIHFGWNEHVASDPDDPHFSFSFGGLALYVIGMHANSSRAARRFPWPVMVFNPHEQFERLRGDGKWKRMQESIRSRDLQLQGSINPMLSDFGVQSEARQYSGRAVEENWKVPFEAASPAKCPFHH
jgi:uncharacterized protein